MKRFTIRRKGSIYGTYSGSEEASALDAYAKDYGFANFADLCAKMKVTRDDHKVEEVN